MSKAAKRRACPAMQREISAAECPFNPFSPAQYDLFSDIEAGVIRKSLDWFLKTAPNRAERICELDRVTDKSQIEHHAWQVAEFHYRRDANGQTCADRWLAAKLPGLKNHEGGI